MGWIRKAFRLRSIAVAFLLCFGLFVCAAVVLILAAPTPQTESEWYATQAARLAAIQITPEMVAAVKPWRCNESSCSYHMTSREGVIPFGDGTGVYVTWHSFHDNEFYGRTALIKFKLVAGTAGKPVSDAVLAVDRQGRMYRNNDHVCGALQLRADGPVRNLEDFLKTRTDDELWQPYIPDAP